MLYQLPSGNTIEIDLQKFLDMSEQDIKDLNAYSTGYLIENPFSNSALDNTLAYEAALEDMEEIDEYESQKVKEIFEIDSQSKLDDLDIDSEFLDDF